MHVVVVEFILETAHVADFRERVQRQASDSLALEAECHVFDVCFDPARADFVLLYEVYSDAAAFEAHLGTSHFREFDASVGPWVREKRVTRLQKK